MAAGSCWPSQASKTGVIYASKTGVFGRGASGDIWCGGNDNGDILEVTLAGVVSTFKSISVGDIFSGIVVDSAGNVYIAQEYIGGIYKITPGGTVTFIASIPADVVALCIDGGGNLYVLGSYPIGIIYKVTPGGTVTTLASGFPYDLGMAIDGSGNLYVPQYPYVQKITPAGVVSNYAAFSINYRCHGAAMDTSGNLFVADYYGKAIYKMPPGGSFSTFASGITYISQITTDKAGNVYALLKISILKFTPDGSQSTLVGGSINCASIFCNG